MRRFARRAFRCGLYEAQDVLAESGGVELLHLEPDRGFDFRQRFQWRLLYHDFTGTVASLNPGLRPVRLTKDYDVFLLVCPFQSDPFIVNAVQGWRDRCQTTICWLDELWAKNVPEFRHWLPFLRQFDHVFLGLHGSVEPVSRCIGKQCHHMPGAVDTLRFTPYPQPPERCIDVYSIGRRWAGIHQRLLEFGATLPFFYVYDTNSLGGDAETPDHRQHRSLYANMAKRSRYFMVAPAKAAMPDAIGGQIEVAFRYFEAAAAGTVLLGQAPDCEPFRRMFDWPDAVIEVQPDGSDVTETISRFAAQPERLDLISRRNAAQALLRHDWVHRWRQIFAVAGLQPTPVMVARERRLQDLAAMAMDR